MWFTADAWGTFEKTDSETVIKILSGKLTLKALALPYIESAAKVTCDGAEIPFGFDKDAGRVAVDCAAEYCIRIVH